MKNLKITVNGKSYDVQVEEVAAGSAPVATAAPVQTAAPAAPAAPVAAPAAVEPNRQELVAAVSAAIAEELGTDITGIRILSLKKI